MREQADLYDLIAAVKVAKTRQIEYDDAQAALSKARKDIVDMIGGDGLSVVANAERYIGRHLTEPDAAPLQRTEVSGG